MAATALAFALAAAPLFADDHMQPKPDAIAIMRPTAGHVAYGTVWFWETGRGVRVKAEFHRLPCNSRHGFHIHEFGDLSSRDGTSLGGHYNPEGHKHSLPMTKMMRHAGDLGNVESDAKGHAMLDEVFTGFSLMGKNPVMGRGMVLHAKPDDGGQPTGNAGARISVGLIGVGR